MNNKIFSSITLPNGVKIKNRIVMAPMTTWGSNGDNTVSDDEIKFYTRRCENLGITITGCTHVSYNGIGFENEFSAYDDRFIPGLTKLASEIKNKNTKAIVQINHAGNKALQHLIKNEDVVSSSDIETLDTEFAKSCKTRAMTNQEVLETIQNFGKTTKRLITAGFDGVEIHGAHGFLIQNFTSPYFNKRTDEWGGSRENRLKFPIKVVEEILNIRKLSEKNDFIIGYRLSPDEPMENSLSMEDTYTLIDKLIELNIDYIHISLPNALADKPFFNNNGKTYLELIAKYVNKRIPLMVAGSVTNPEQFIKILENNYDFVALGKILVTDPDWQQKILENKEKDIEEKLDLENKNLDLPKKLIEEIIKNKGWFKIK